MNQPSSFPPEEVPPSLPRWKRAVFGASSLSSALLLIQAGAPLAGTSIVPSWINWFFFWAMAAGLALFLAGKRNDERLGGLMVAVASIHLLETTRLFSHYSLTHLSSLLSEALSWTFHGAALVALFYAWTTIVFAWLAARALRVSLGSPSTAVHHMISGVFWIAGAVGVRAVIGYATGSPSLFFE